MKRCFVLVVVGLSLLAYAGFAYATAGPATPNFTYGTDSANQYALGEYLNEIYLGAPSEIQNPLVITFGSGPYLAALNNLSPEGYAAFRTINLGSFEQFKSLILGHLAALRSPATLAGEDHPLLFADSGTMMLDAAPILYTPATDGAGGWGVWGEGFGIFGRQFNNSGNLGYDYNTYGFSLGVDRAIGEKFTVGLATGYSHSFVDFNNTSFDGIVNSFDLGIYGSYNPGAWYLDASFTWARNWHDTERYDLFALATAEAQYHGDVFAWYLGGGYNIDLGKARITPVASLTYTYYNQPRFTEDGADPFNLVVHRFDSHSLVSRLGLTFAYEFDLEKVTIVPEASAEWAHEYLSTDRTIVSRLEAIGTSTFAVDGVNADRDGALLGLGVTAYFGKGLSVYGDYNADLRGHYNSHGFTIGVRYEF